MDSCKYCGKKKVKSQSISTLDRTNLFAIVVLRVKKIFILLPVLLLVLVTSIVHPVYATSSTSSVSLSDAIYADLAVRHYLDNASVYYTNGKLADNVALNETRHWLPASTVKTFAAVYAYKLIKEGKINLNDTVTIDGKNEVSTELVTDELPTLLTGDTVTIDRLIRQMITQSDNTAFNQLLDILGRDNVTNYIQSLGLTHSHVGSKLNLDDTQTQFEYDVPGYGINTTTAEDYGKIFTLIKQNKIPGAKELFAVLARQKINNMIPRYLPKEVVCAHKTGDLDPLFHDGGICQDKKQSYVLTVMTNAGDPDLIAHLSEIIYTRNFDLVGSDISKSTVGELPQEQHPLDPLVMNPPTTAVLGTSTTINFPTPEITAADIGLTAKDLSIVLKDKDLPQVVIPADSPFHVLSDAWQITKKIVVPGADARRDVDLETAKLRIAEAKDLQKRGKQQEALTILNSMQSGLIAVSKDPTITHDAVVQDTIAAVSETRFDLLGNSLQQVKGADKVQLIQQIAKDAKQQIQIQQNTPVATNATDPNSKILAGTVIKVTDTSYDVKTAAGVVVTIPNTPAVTIMQTALTASSPTPTGVPGVSGEISQTPSPSGTITPSETVTVAVTPTPNLRTTITVGSTIAVAGTQKGTTFAASVIIPNVPKELIAPEPVTVAKVDTKHDTMVVVENGVYTQVNINRDTSIKGTDTSIPLKAIQPGDVVIVHGTPLVEVTPTPLPVTGTPSIPVTPLPSSPTSAPGVASPTTIPGTTIPVATTGIPAKIGVTGTPSLTGVPTITQGVNKNTPTGSVTGIPGTNKTVPTLLPQKNVPTSPQSPTLNKTSVTPSVPSSSPSPAAPRVIQSTSVQLIEKKQDIPTSHPAQPTQQSTPTPQTHDAPKSQSQSQPQPQSATTNSAPVVKTDDKKK